MTSLVNIISNPADFKKKPTITIDQVDILDSGVKMSETTRTINTVMIQDGFLTSDDKPLGLDMLENRIADLFSSSVAVATAPMMAFGSFVPCPVMMVAPSQMMQIAEVYRIAAQLTREQLQPVKRLGIPEFSLN